MACLLRRLLLLLSVLVAAPALADPAKFDLAGPSLSVRVTRAGVSLPIGETPSLAAGDQVWIRADLPAGQSAHYMLVSVFLRGATNPPPKRWFSLSETWKPTGRDGLRITAPVGAEQLLVLLAPDRPGGFKTLMGAVRGRPGAFVRASQDLVQAGLDRSRLEAFLSAVGRTGAADPVRLKAVSALLARSLVIKLNADCFQKLSELQAACLTQGEDSLVLNDGHGASIVESLTSGNPAELVQQLGATPQAGFGYYSPYIGAVLDIARILDSFHTPQFQYIPALADVRGERVSLILNTAPSFHNPLSVLVAALPPVTSAPPPPLAPVDAHAAYCLRKPGLVLPVDGAPLVFSTGYLHDTVLRVTGPGGAVADLPAVADPERGGFVVDASRLPVTATGSTEGALRGDWGFAPYDGPKFPLRDSAGGAPWRLSDDDAQALIVGRDDVVHLVGDTAACVEGVGLRDASGEVRKAEWKADPDGALTVTAPLAKVKPGPLELVVTSYGQPQAQILKVQAFAQTGRIEGLAYHAGDRSAVLKGTRLDEVASVTLDGAAFTPGALASNGGTDELVLQTAGAAPAIESGTTASARVVLADGRSLHTPVLVAAPRPSISLIARSVAPAADRAPLRIELAGRDEAPWDGRITFSLRAAPPAVLSARDQVEVAAPAAAVSAILRAGSGLVLEDPQVAVAQLDPAATFGPSAFGPLRFRLLHEGAASDWQPLGVLVRLPGLRALKCPEQSDRPCELSGADLFLIDSVSRDPTFAHVQKVPEGFPGAILMVPHPAAGGRLFVRLRDDPEVTDTVMTPGAHAAAIDGAAHAMD